jgi:hypothetical protein
LNGEASTARTNRINAIMAENFADSSLGKPG